MMFRGKNWTTLVTMLAASGLLFAAGCIIDADGSDDDDQLDEMQDTFSGEDTGIADAGDDEKEDTSVMDAGEKEDTGGKEDTDEMEDTGTDVTEDTGGEEYNCTFFPDNCGDGQQCRYNPQAGERECIPTGNAMAGDSCGSQTLCAKGLTCTGSSQDNLSCRTKCDPDNTEEYGCGGGTCAPLGTQGGEQLPYGACQPSCEPFPDDSCGEGENCYPTENGRTCAEYNPDAQVGDSCSTPTDCGNNQICIQGQSGNTCQDKCDTSADNPCGGGSSCQALQSVDYGVCTSSGG